VVEILETVDPDPTLISACLELKKMGYRIALDDFVDHPRFAPFAELADIIKVDVRLSPPAVWADMARKYVHTHALLAEKVETHEEFAAAARLGYVLFQGYFFCKPAVVSARDIPGSCATHLKILQATNALELDFLAIEALIKSEPSLYYRIFRYLNSAAFSFQTEIKSIIQALTLLGERDVRKWLMLGCAVLASEGKPPELVGLALVRARFCELLARHTGASESASFMLGLFSLMDAILDAPMEVILKQVSLPSEVSAALLGRHNLLRCAYELALTFEAGDWATCAQVTNVLSISEDAVNQAHVSAVEWEQGLQ
jgi:EAL and modified HD-GYP domain-containing signal transduction protein